MELREVMRTTPATREFTPEPVDDEVVASLLEVARFAPSGGNRQGWHVIVLKDPELRRHVRDLYVVSWREYMAHVHAGLVAFAPIDHGNWTGPAVDLEAARATPAPMAFADHLDRAPVLLALWVELAALAVIDNGLGRQSIAGGGSIYPFGHNILLAARDLGLGGVMTTALARQEPAVKELLGVPDGYALAGLLALGHPAHQVTRLRRAPVEEFTTVDHFAGPAFPLSHSGGSTP
jgi:nitroreductase